MTRGALFSLIVVLLIAWPVVAGMGLGRARVDQNGEPGAPQVSRGGATGRVRTPRKEAAAHDDYQIPAGAVIRVELRTTIGSASSAAGDQVDAGLAEPVMRDGVELLPVGSMVRGTIVDALPSSRHASRGRVAFAFFVIEHARTGSRAAIKSRPITVDASPPVDKRPMDVMLAAGHRMNVILAEPLLVRIPR